MCVLLIASMQVRCTTSKRVGWTLRCVVWNFWSVAAAAVAVGGRIGVGVDERDGLVDLRSDAAAAGGTVDRHRQGLRFEAARGDDDVVRPEGERREPPSRWAE